MNYIVLDLEWNHSNNNTNQYIPFEIIEIGAVKLNNKREIISNFSELIKPQVYTEINEVVKEIINLDNRDFEDKE